MAQPKEGSIVHVELHSSDPTRTKEFYKEVFGWKFQDIPEMNYTTFQAPNAPHGGLQKHGEKGPTVLNYIMANDIARTLERIENAGGKVVVPKSEIPMFGWYAVFQEPGGTVQAVYQDMPKSPPAKKPAAKKAKKGGKRRK
jgi:predicted enzyme related to lactoylglutathione lyase